MASRELLVFFFFLFALFFSSNPRFFLASADNVIFDFRSVTPRNFTLLGDSHLQDGVFGLTQELGVPSSSSGTVIFNCPIPFFDQESNTTASFNTSFSFSIKNLNTSFDDGLAFFMSQDNQTLGSPGRYLGLVNSSQLTKNRFIAVEFDTRLDPHFGDPNDNHVGFDIDSLNSIKTADPSSQGIDLKSGNRITAWIDYKNELRLLIIFLSSSDSKPQHPLLTVDIDLSGYLRQIMYVGFSASTEGSSETHSIDSWSFRSFGFHPVRPRLHPHNVSDSSTTIITGIHGSSSGNKHHKKLGLVLGIAGPVFFCVALSLFGCLSLRKRKGRRTEKNLKAEFVAGPREFSYKELKSATRGFHSSRIIGQGAFGNVYLAILISSGTIAAVKRLRHSHEGKIEFLAELSIIACLRHKNLVQLQGWCAEMGELLLVHEFMLNGSLDKILYQESESGTQLSWSHRKNIAVGLASVLCYLHHECKQQVIHRDIKTSNIMLDGKFNARLGDFGLARPMDPDKSPVSTLTAGTMGYLAPEYLQYGKATEKTDVFSYGVVVLEVACARRPMEKEPDGQRTEHLVDWVWGLHAKGRLLEAADKRLNWEFKEEEMRKLLLVGLSCALPDIAERPSMRRVLQILNNEAEPVLVPKRKPSLTFSCSFNVEDIVSDDEGDSFYISNEECKTDGQV